MPLHFKFLDTFAQEDEIFKLRFRLTKSDCTTSKKLC